MTDGVYGKGSIGVRAGAHALSLLSTPLSVQVLRALANGPRPLVDLRRAVGSPPQTTMRSHLRSMVELDIVRRHRREPFPGSVDYEITDCGRGLTEVADVVERWLAQAPDGPVSLDGQAAKSAIKALVDGWNSSIIRALAARPLSLTDLNRLIAAHNYPSLERRLVAMRLAGQIDIGESGGRRKPYSVSDWLRRAVAPLVAAARWERKHQPDQTTPAGRLEVEAYFLLAVPLLDLSADLNGTCRLLVELRNAKGEHELVGAMVTVRSGEVVSCVSRLQGDADAWAVGRVSTWLRAMVGVEADQLELGGDSELSAALADAFHAALARSEPAV